MSRKEEIELCLDKLKHMVEYDSMELRRSEINSKKKKSTEAWVNTLERHLDEIKMYVSEYNSI